MMDWGHKNDFFFGGGVTVLPPAHHVMPIHPVIYDVSSRVL